jgi:hypothetical protein
MTSCHSTPCLWLFSGKKNPLFMHLLSSAYLRMSDDHKIGVTLFRMAHTTPARATSGSQNHLFRVCRLMCCCHRLAALLDLASPCPTASPTPSRASARSPSLTTSARSALCRVVREQQLVALSSCLACFLFHYFLSCACWCVCVCARACACACLLGN